MLQGGVENPLLVGRESQRASEHGEAVGAVALEAGDRAQGNDAGGPRIHCPRSVILHQHQIGIGRGGQHLLGKIPATGVADLFGALGI